MIKITADELRLFIQYIYKVSGVLLDDSKAYLLESRLAGLLKENRCTSFMDLYRLTSGDAGKIFERKIIDAITTNETLFFRDKGPFDLLRYKIIPELIDRRRAARAGKSAIPIRVWSAGCSTGQEIYSIAMVLKESLPDISRFDLRLIGTDISDAAVTAASYGQYNQFEIDRGTTQDILRKYFVPIGNAWRIKDEIRAMASFKRMNLMQPFNGIGKFDIVFCRNVCIYFGQNDRKALFERIGDVLEKDGYLIIGSTETLMGISSRFRSQRHLKTIFYQPA
jgi:chemotaxis protein methyltransferase CheR